MKNSATLIAVTLSLVACGGGGGGGSSPTPAPVQPVTTQPVVVPPVVTPPVVAPPVVTQPVVVVPPVIVPPMAACAAPTTEQPVVLWDRTAMKAICNSVYIEPGLTADEELYQRQSVAFATQQVTAYYGVMTVKQPDIILCKTAACRTYFNGTTGGVFAGAGTRLPGATYITARPAIIIIYTSFLAFGRNAMTHELSHAEFHERTSGGLGVPSWFDEGQATLIGKDPDCTNVSTVNILADLTVVDGGQAWLDHTNLGAAGGDTGTRVYCQAQREVSAWVTKNGQPKYLALLASVKAGVPFYSVYGKLLTQ